MNDEHQVRLLACRNLIILAQQCCLVLQLNVCIQRRHQKILLQVIVANNHKHKSVKLLTGISPKSVHENQTLKIYLDLTTTVLTRTQSVCLFFQPLHSCYGPTQHTAPDTLATAHAMPTTSRHNRGTAHLNHTSYVSPTSSPLLTSSPSTSSSDTRWLPSLVSQ